MPGSIANTSPLLHLGRIGALAWLDQLFGLAGEDVAG